MKISAISTLTHTYTHTHTHTHTLTFQENIMHQRAMDNDETYYLWATRFFMEFSRHHQFRVDIVG